MNALRERTSRFGIWNFAGCLAVAATLALTSPGVRIASASDGEHTAVPEAAGLVSIDPALARSAEGVRAASCTAPSEAGVADEAVAQRLRQVIQQEARRLAALQGPGAADGGHVVLNGRGYNYSRTLQPGQ